MKFPKLLKSIEALLENGLQPSIFNNTLLIKDIAILEDWAKVDSNVFLNYCSPSFLKQLLIKNESINNQQLKSPSNLLKTTLIPFNSEDLKNLNIEYSFIESVFGALLIGTSNKGICYVAFTEDRGTDFLELKQTFPNAQLSEILNDRMKSCIKYFETPFIETELTLHVKGSDFQLKVWNALISLPFGTVMSYSNLAKMIGNANSARAVGTAVGCNSVAFFIPCHRVIKTSGILGEYRWGKLIKPILLGWEQVKLKQALEVNH